MLHVIRIKEKCLEFLFFNIFSRNENTKGSGFYTIQVTKVFSNFPKLKQLNKIKNGCEYCDLLGL